MEPDCGTGYYVDCLALFLWDVNETDPETGRTWRSATHSYMNETFSPCKGVDLDKPSCEWMDNNFNLFRGGGIMVCTVISLFAMPAFLCEDMGEATQNQHSFLKRVYTTMPARDRTGGIMYILRAYLVL